MLLIFHFWRGKNDSIQSLENIEMSLIEKFIEMEKERAEREQNEKSSE